MDGVNFPYQAYIVWFRYHVAFLRNIIFLGLIMEKKCQMLASNVKIDLERILYSLKVSLSVLHCIDCNSTFHVQHIYKLFQRI